MSPFGHVRRCQKLNTKNVQSSRAATGSKQQNDTVRTTTVVSHETSRLHCLWDAGAFQGLSDEIIAHLMTRESQIDRFAYQGMRTMLIRVSSTHKCVCKKKQVHRDGGNNLSGTDH